MLYPNQQEKLTKDTSEIDSVSLIYLSQNGAAYLERKINFLIKELSAFKHFEIIVIDDHSTDNSLEVVQQFVVNDFFTFIHKPLSKGIPHSMNMAVELVKYEHMVFCDQRQCLSVDVLKKLLSPLNYEEVGAVSACISNRDKEKRLSLIRVHENFIKYHEGRIGSLIGVYGPLYAMKKSCYREIPEHIILDDLYLTLRILPVKQVWFARECEIYDEDCDTLYDYDRAKRYLHGFIQLFSEKEMLRSLSFKHLLMLFWHKYFRLIIPLVLLGIYIVLGILSFSDQQCLWLFIAVSGILLISIAKGFVKSSTRILSPVRINIYYSLSMIHISIAHYFRVIRNRFNTPRNYKLNNGKRV